MKPLKILKSFIRASKRSVGYSELKEGSNYIGNLSKDILSNVNDVADDASNETNKSSSFKPSKAQVAEVQQRFKRMTTISSTILFFMIIYMVIMLSRSNYMSVAVLFFVILLCLAQLFKYSYLSFCVSTNNYQSTVREWWNDICQKWRKS